MNLINQQVGRYDVVGFLGAGATGVVFEAIDRDSGARAALKALKPPRTSATLAEQLRRRFVAEIDVLSRLRDIPQVVTISDSGQLRSGVLYFTMELLRGQTLQETLDEVGLLTPAAAAPLVAQICQGLEAIHQRGIVHRDIKPSNIFLAEDDSGATRPVLIDFGIAKRLKLDERLTLGAMGSPLFAAPEQAANEGHLIGPPTDIYALGVTAYGMLSATDPFDIPPDTEAYDVMTLRRRAEPVPLGHRVPQLPRALCTLIDRSLARLPAVRPQSARAFFSAFERAANAGGSGMLTTRWARTRTRTGVASSAASGGPLPSS